MTNYEFTKAAQEKLDETWERLEKHYGRKVVKPGLTFDLRSGSCAGLAVGAHTIRLNLGYVRENAQDMLDRTVPHEATHIWLYAIKDPSHVSTPSYSSFRRRRRSEVHGYAFQSVMRMLGADESRCHKMGKSDFARLRKTWAYKCPGCGHVYQLSTVIHNKILRGQGRFHPACGQVRGRLERVR